MNHKTLWAGLSILLLQSFLGGTAGAASYTLTLNISGSGTVLRNPTNSVYPSGATVTLTAISNSPTWYFASWSGDATGTANPPSVYHLQTSTNLLLWQDLETNGPFANPTNITRTISTQAAPRQFYRVWLQ
jgi:hypothetical protein